MASSSSSSDDDDEISESEVEHYETKAYNHLKAGGKDKIIRPGGSFRCPFCINKMKQNYMYKDLLQHATGIGASNARSFRQKANHLALARFLRSDIPPSSNIAAAAPPPPSGNSSTSPQPQPQGEDHFVWPWMGVLTHVPISGASAPDLSRFNPAEILHLWDENAQGRGTTIVKFSKDWSGFKDAMAFRNHFEANHLGKEDWRERGDAEGSSAYGWMAGEDDYNSEGPVAHVLRNNGRLRTVSDLTEEEARERKREVAMLTDQIEAKNERIHYMESRYNATALSIQQDKIKLESQSYGGKRKLDDEMHKEDIELETGEYFMSNKAKTARKWQQKLEKQAHKSVENKTKREDAFVPPKEPLRNMADSTKSSDDQNEVAAVTMSLKKKAKDFQKDKANANIKAESYIADAENPPRKKSKSWLIQNSDHLIDTRARR